MRLEPARSQTRCTVAGDTRPGRPSCDTTVGLPDRQTVLSQGTISSIVVLRDRRLTAPTLADGCPTSPGLLLETRTPRPHRRHRDRGLLGDPGFATPSAGKQQDPRSL